MIKLKNSKKIFTDYQLKMQDVTVTRPFLGSHPQCSKAKVFLDGAKILTTATFSPFQPEIKPNSTRKDSSDGGNMRR